MKKNTVDVLGIPFLNTTMDELVNTLKMHSEKKEKAFVITANPEIVMFARGNEPYMKKVQTANYITADGVGVIKAARVLGTPLPERVSGYDIMNNLLHVANEKKLSVYFLGAKEDVIGHVVDRVKEKYPNLVIAGSHHGYFDLNDELIVKEVKDSKPDFIFVALGFPRQEEWISKYINQFEKGIFMGVGGSFDILAGKAKRAPYFWRSLNIEWLYRLMKQPSRWKRMLVLPQFMVQVYKIKMKK